MVTLAIAGEKALVRDVAGHGTRDLGHAIDQSDVFVSQAGLQVRAKHNNQHRNASSPAAKIARTLFSDFPGCPLAAQ
jgi:hypothetical protein